MAPSTLKNDLVNLAEYALKKCSSPTNLAIIIRLIEQMEENPESIATTLRKIRIAVRLFIDEEIAEDLYEEMTSVALPK
ncbi:MAG: hypothetical protein GY854_22005 [Deltaproteobacteria bacterium]|nr:hypothetical protein [Deltaproteobacteria bacterium]